MKESKFACLSVQYQDIRQNRLIRKCSAGPKKNVMKIQNINDFRNFENQINAAFRQYKLDHILLGIKFAKSKLEPFVIAGMTLFAFRNCTAGPKCQQVKYLEWNHVSYLAHLVTQYLLADPLTFDKSILKRFQNSNPVFAMLRIVGNQFPYNVNLFGQYARPMILFNDLPKQLVCEKGVSPRK